MSARVNSFKIFDSIWVIVIYSSPLNDNPILTSNKTLINVKKAFNDPYPPNVIVSCSFWHLIMNLSLTIDIWYLFDISKFKSKLSFMFSFNFSFNRAFHNKSLSSLDVLNVCLHYYVISFRNTICKRVRNLEQNRFWLNIKVGFNIESKFLRKYLLLIRACVIDIKLQTNTVFSFTNNSKY